MTSGVVETGTILDQILRRTAADVAARRVRRPVDVVEEEAMATPVRASLREGVARPGMSVIAEFKRASPSKGRFPVEMQPSEVASEYVAGGAIGMSVLTDEPFFQGSLADLTAAASIAHVAQPPVAILRKDFVIDEYQILEARAACADAVLLIVAALSQAHLVRLQENAAKIGLDALVEVHTEEEMTRAADAGATLIGINNRDLHLFSVDLAVSERLVAHRPTGALIVAESGIANRSDVERLEAVGVDAILVGESLVLSPDRAAGIRTLRGSGC